MRSASDCTGDTESLLRSFDPTFSDLIFNLISLEYHESLMAPSGDSAEKSLNDAISKYAGQYN
jgi:Ni,Fe-hydrogenase I small subunit